MDNRQPRTINPERRKINKVNLMTTPAYCLEVVSRLQYREREPKQKPVFLQNIGKTSKFRESMVAKICKTESWKGQLHKNPRRAAEGFV